MAFETLTEKFSSIFKKLRGKTTLNESNMDEMLKEIRIALLEADVNFKVVKSFINDVKEAAVGQEVYKKINPSQMVVKICHDEIVSLLGSDQTEINYNKDGVTSIMLVGLQGTGKTTTAGKLASLMKSKLNKKVLLAAMDVYRPAAIEQLKQLSETVGVDFFSLGTNVSPVEISKQALAKAKNEHYDVLIMDTAGRLQIDETLMTELKEIAREVKPTETLLLIDAMSGQDAVNVANSFNADLRLTGAVMSKLDGDARGGAALSVKYLTGVPIKFAGIGEKINDLEIFYPTRMADRILGMGDIVTLVEKAKEAIDEKEAEADAKKMLKGSFTLEDMVDQMKKINRIGSLGSIAKMIPGMPSLTDEQQATAKREMKIMEAVVNSMTKYERVHPECLRYSQKNRIAKGSGTTNADINRVIKKYEQSKEMMKMLKKYKDSGRMPPGMGGLGF